MAATDDPSRLMPLAEELLDNPSARDNLRQGAEKLRDATAALASGRKKPTRTGRKVLAGLLVVGAAGAAAYWYLNDQGDQGAGKQA
jgi:hypothetical protein